MALELRLPPGKTAVIQLKVRTVGSNTPGANVGSPITGTASGADYSFALGAYATGDYWAQLSGVSSPVGSAFPVRDGVAYPGIPWTIVDATIYVPPIIAPPDVDEVCRVQMRARRGAAAIQSRVLITCGSTGRIDDSAFANIAFDGQTDANGLLQVELPWSSVSGVGKYRFRLIDIDTGTVFHDRTVTVPDLTTALYQALT
jgi:hypothetical protein